MSALVLRTSIEVDATREELWPILTDTERMNRSLGLGSVTFRPIEAAADTRTAKARERRRAREKTEHVASPARYLAETKLGGMRVTYDEEPFEFVAPDHYSVRRVMHNGLLSELTMRVSLEAISGGARTRASYVLELMPRLAIYRPVLQLATKRVLESIVADAQDAVKVAHGQRGNPTPAAEIDPGHLARALAGLEGEQVDRALIDKLAELVTNGHDADVVALRPFEIARRWGFDDRAVLRALLLSVKTGLFELRWALVCPSCRTFSERLTTLEEIPSEGHCQLCDVDFELDMDRAIEATFVVHPGVRRVNDTTFCIGGPARTPHVLVQTNIAPHGSAVFVAPEATGRYRFFMRGGAALRVTIEGSASGASGGDGASDPPRASSAEVSTDGDTFASPELVLAPSARITVTNATDQARHVKLERLEYASTAATAAVLSTFDEFRRIFSADLLKRGTPLKVARVAMFFSDLTGSTALYSKVGDAAAFRIVDDHFDLMRAVIAEHHGVLVKTMGDAAMAAFHDVRSCAAAAVDVLRRFESFRAERPHGDEVGMKVGMYSGPCYVVTANGVLDYFGQTVNITSRVQHLAESGELVIAPSDFELLGDDARAALTVIETFQARVKGVDAPLDLLRVRLIHAPAQRENAPSVSMSAARAVELG